MHRNHFNLIRLFAILTTAHSLELIPINNPILPIKLGNAKIPYSHHTFVHYFNYSTIATQLNSIYDSIQAVNNKFRETTNDLTNTTVIISKINFKDLDYTYQLAVDKYNNLLPHIRIKRGLVNAVGITYKWMFGTLDAEDGERYDQAIETLVRNQRQIHDKFNEQISFSKKLINKLNNTLSRINDNQINIANHLNQLQTNLDNWFLAITDALTLNSIARQILDNCLILIGLINDLENSITFGNLNIVNLNTLKVNEMTEIIDYMNSNYPNQFVEFSLVLSYYHLLRTQVFFTKDRIIFTYHMPLFEPIDYQYLKIFSIPLNNVITIPSSPYLLTSRTQSIGRSSTCTQMEDLYFCTKEDQIHDDCLDNLLRDPHKNKCPSRPVEVHQTITYQLDDNLIIVPRNPEYIYEKCQYDTDQLIETPSLLKMKSPCKYQVRNLTYDIDETMSTSQPLMLPEISIEIIQNISYNRIKLKPTHIEDINTLNDLINSMDPLQEISYTDHRISTLVLTFLITGIIIVTCLWYRYIGCKCLQAKRRLTKVVVVPREEIPLEQKQSFPN